MKTLELGGKKYKLLENTKEVSAIRSLEIEFYKLKTFLHGTDTLDVMRAIESYMKAFDLGKMSDCHIYLHNLKNGLLQIENRINPSHYVFALIVMEEAEVDSVETRSHAYLTEKLERIYATGISQGEIDDHVIFFFLDSHQSAAVGGLQTLANRTNPQKSA